MPSPVPHSLLMLAALLGTLARGAGAQETEPDDDRRPDARQNPLLTDRSLERDIAERTSRPEAGAALLPSREPRALQVVPNQPADPTRFVLEDGTVGWTGAATLLPEGTFLVRRVGEVVRLRVGGLAFLPATREGEPPDPALPLLACEITGRLDTLLNADDRALWMSLTGEAFQYRGRNYLLPTAFASEAAPGVAEPEPAADQPVPPQEPAQPDQASPPDDRIEQLIRELESERAERKGIDTRFDAAPPGEGAGTPGPRIEGKLLLSRRARMVRSAGGGWVVAIDNDADAGERPPGAFPDRLYLLPCRLVAEMESQAEREGDAWTFEVSGNLFSHGDRVYLLPRLFVSLPRDEVDPLQ